MMTGASFAEYKNQDVTATLTLSENEKHTLVASSGEALIGVKLNMEACAGIGIAACTELLLSKDGLGPIYDISSDIEKHNSEETAATIGFTFSYATSAQIEDAGRRSTMLLTPSLTIVFSKSLQVKFDKDICMATGTEVTTWSLGGTENFKV